MNSDKPVFKKSFALCLIDSSLGKLFIQYLRTSFTAYVK